MNLPSALLATSAPLFGSLPLALAAVLGCVVALVAAVALLGRWLAATHPAPTAAALPAVLPPSAPAEPVAVRASPEVGPGVPAEIVTVATAVAAQIFGTGIRVAAVRVAPPARVGVPSLESLMQQWSYEGRRQIYSSHKVR